MFNKIKDINALRKQAQDMKNMLEDEVVEAENKGIKIKMNGNQEVLEVTINPELDQETQEKYLKETFNDAVKKVQKLMATKMMGSGFQF